MFIVSKHLRFTTYVFRNFPEPVSKMMKRDHIEHFMEDSSRRDTTKLNGVFNKISDIWQHQNSVSRQKMSSEVIESILPERFNIPIAGRKYYHLFMCCCIHFPHFNVLKKKVRWAILILCICCQCVWSRPTPPDGS